MASGLSSKTKKEQVSIFLYAVDDCVDSILATLSIDEETVSFADIKRELNDYFGARKNVVVERARFNKRVQRQSETNDSFIQDLYKIAEGCSYGVLKKELIRQNCGGGCQRQSLRAPPGQSQPQAARGHAAE